ncbi:hypothetical protein VB264_01985 [Arcicella aquatica]|uniref:Uncharacterized protein n=1 Tax=Arcicella aquatica TaxID=217141 RepID=A0ABU5QHN0_9BACT|nr:hypothetical protein [Arcicella aquatica]MEA5256533.1 hypothetical protein [Arcicella aquatica]
MSDESPAIGRRLSAYALRCHVAATLAVADVPTKETVTARVTATIT